ncbi:metallophosphoesterase family protein [Noviherbaspirillum soli]|uniref:metallophosphoesterase family protein n=1 Tax=Noviherbaspirillum soli TaxID=1064518 RepID=UPI00188AB9DF|nr:metallophosphoesterase [Noviherbaspirillum soli]
MRLPFPHFLFRLTALLALSACASAPRPPSFTGKPVTVYAAGDIADCRYRAPQDSGAAATAMLVKAGLAADPGAMALTLGDHTYPVGLPAEFNDCYHPTWGQFRESTLPVPGNHEYYTAGAPGYYAYFGARAAQEQGGYYSVQLGKWHVIGLNSALDGAAAGAQLAWLRNDLARHPARCTLAMLHHPRYSSGGHASNPAMAPLWQALVAGGVELLLSAHDHNYERFAPQDAAGRRDDALGMRQFVVGTGGAMLTPVRLDRANSEVKDNSVHGVLRLDLFDTGYTWEFLPVASEASPPFTDRGASTCH